MMQLRPAPGRPKNRFFRKWKRAISEKLPISTFINHKKFHRYRSISAISTTSAIQHFKFIMASPIDEKTIFTKTAPSLSQNNFKLILNITKLDFSICKPNNNFFSYIRVNKRVLEFWPAFWRFETTKLYIAN